MNFSHLKITKINKGVLHMEAPCLYVLALYDDFYNKGILLEKIQYLPKNFKCKNKDCKDCVFNLVAMEQLINKLKRKWK